MVAIPHVPIGKELVDAINYLSEHLDFFFDAISSGISALVSLFYDIMALFPPALLILVVAIIAWKA